MGAGEDAGHRIERMEAVRDDGGDIDHPLFQQPQRPNIRQWSPVRVVPARRTDGRDKGGFEKLHGVERTQVGAGVPVAIEQDRPLLPHKRRDCIEDRTRPRRLDQEFGTSPSAARRNLVCEVGGGRVDGVGAESFGQRAPVRDLAR